jgi:peptidoglycan/LPS O-acetylase OafA/YrhL
MMMYQGFKVDWGKKILGNGYAMLLAALAFFLCMQVGLPDVISVSFLPFILLSAAYGGKSIDRLFGTRALQKLGDCSFSIYLVHQPLLFTIGSIMAYFNPMDPGKLPAGPPPAPNLLLNWGVCLVFILVTLLVSSITYRFVELPARKWINSKAA